MLNDADASTEKKQCIFVVRIKLKLKAYDRYQSTDHHKEKDAHDYRHQTAAGTAASAIIPARPPISAIMHIPRTGTIRSIR